MSLQKWKPQWKQNESDTVNNKKSKAVNDQNLK